MSSIVGSERRILMLNGEQCVIARGAIEPLEVCDPDGQVVGHMLSIEQYALLNGHHDKGLPTDWVERWLEFYEEDLLDDDSNARRKPK